MTATDLRRRITEAWNAAWDRGETGPLGELLHDDYRRIGSNVQKSESKEELLASILETRAAFPDLTTHIDEIVVEGDVAAIRWHSAGRHEAPMMGIPATHRPVEVAGATFAHFEGDLIIGENVTWDPSALLTALGIIHIDRD